eukprot:210895_1
MSKENQTDRKTNKLLFLGPGGSGKSTIFKQLQWLHLGGFTRNDALKLKQYIHYQIIAQMKNIIKHYSKKEPDIHYDDDVLQEAISVVQNVPNTQHRTLTLEIADAIQYIWTHEPRIRQAFGDPEVSKYQILDETTQYFWNDLDRIKDDAYVPNQSDILNVRYKTTGVTDEKFDIGKVKFHIFDVGGQKSERKKMDPLLQ